MLIFTHDKSRLARHFQKDPVLFAYHLGDLDDYFFPKCQWAADNASWSAIAEAILIYSGGQIPAVLAFGLTERFNPLLEELLDLLPPRFYGHYLKQHQSILRGQFIEQAIGTHFKMALTRQVDIPPSPPLGRHVKFGPDDADQLIAFYKIAYPDGYFDVDVLPRGFSNGIIADGMIVAASGLHCMSVEHKVGAIGNIATHPDWRGNGLASYLTALQSKELQDKGCLVCLNVAASNDAAVRCYTKLGFETRHEFEEGIFRRR